MALTTAPLLRMPANDSKFLVEADSSDYATGAVLSQEHDGKWHPVAFMSKALTEVERNYEIYDKELLAVVRALEEWSQYLKGAVHCFEILSDHQNLKYFQTARKLNRRQARWSLILSEFDFTLTHRSGKSSGKPDALSRRADHGTGQDDNSDIVLLKPEFFIRAMRSQGHVETVTEMEEVLKKIRREGIDAEGERVKVQMGNDATEEQGLLVCKGKVYVPRKWRRTTIIKHHNAIDAGHPGQAKTLELISRNYWWLSCVVVL